MGGTSFSDLQNPAQYWASTNGPNLQSALSYIPEGTWNEPQQASDRYLVESGGGGMSVNIARPSWQVGTGVPAGSTRVVPDISFPAAGRDGYFGCYKGACITTTAQTTGQGGTSASAPTMAGVVALLNTQKGAPSGNINPLIYSLADSENYNTIFHDVTPVSSGVANCDASVPSRCNNSFVGPSGTIDTGVMGFAVTDGYDTATGWGHARCGELPGRRESKWKSDKSLACAAPLTQIEGSTLRRIHLRSIKLFISTLFIYGTLQAQSVPSADLVPAGTVRPEVAGSVDLGATDPAVQLNGLVLELRAGAAEKSALEATVRSLHDPASSTFHQWLTPAQFTAQLAISSDSVASAQSWLQAQGFTVTGLSATRSAVYFSGTVAQVNAAFRTQMHQLRAPDGQVHTANMTMPTMPASLAAVSSGLIGLHDFRPHHVGSAGLGPQFVGGNGGSDQNLGAGDLQTIYGINKVHAAGFSGQGQTIAVLEDSDVYSTGDWLAYRRVFGLTKAFPQGQLVVQHPSGAYPCSDPGVLGADEEATLDAEVATAAAPNASVIVASCQTSVGNDPLLVALANLLASPNPPQVVSISYGSPEASFSEAERQEMETLYMQAAGQGVSVFVSGGDDGADANHADRQVAGVNGISTNGRATTQWNVAVGGTDFEDTYLGNTAQYWSPASSATGQSALSYVPEFTWNGTCGSELLAQQNGFSATYGSSGFCNSPLAPTRYNGAGGGGQSACRTGVPAVAGVIGGTCAGEPKPVWQQNVPGVPNDGVRDIPDVALFASSGAWKHAYAICFSGPSASSNPVPCTDRFVTNGGTSASTPLMAGVQLLIDQATQSMWGNPNPIYYALARNQFQPGTIASCDASLGTGVGAGCVFHDITAGDNVAPCAAGSLNCFAPSGKAGVFSLSTTSYQPAFKAGAGWDYTTGNGSIDAGNLLQFWTTGVALSGAMPIQ